MLVPWRVFVWFLYFNLKCAFIWTYSTYSASHFGTSIEEKIAFVIKSMRQEFSDGDRYLTLSADFCVEIVSGFMSAEDQVGRRLGVDVRQRKIVTLNVGKTVHD